MILIIVLADYFGFLDDADGREQHWWRHQPRRMRRVS
jgi:hypothetical protein